MTPMAQEVVIETSSKLAGELTTLFAFKKDSATVEDFWHAITKLLTAFSAQQVIQHHGQTLSEAAQNHSISCNQCRAIDEKYHELLVQAQRMVWEEALEWMGNRRYYDPETIREFRRRATHAEGKE